MPRTCLWMYVAFRVFHPVPMSMSACCIRERPPRANADTTPSSHRSRMFLGQAGRQAGRHAPELFTVPAYVQSVRLAVARCAVSRMECTRIHTHLARWYRKHYHHYLQLERTQWNTSLFCGIHSAYRAASSTEPRTLVVRTRVRAGSSTTSIRCAFGAHFAALLLYRAERHNVRTRLCLWFGRNVYNVNGTSCNDNRPRMFTLGRARRTRSKSSRR